MRNAGISQGCHCPTCSGNLSVAGMESVTNYEERLALIRTDCTRKGYAASVRRQSRQRLRSPNKSGNDITMELCIFTKMCFVSERTDCHGAVRLAMTRQVVFVKKASIPKEKDAAQERHQGVTGFGSLADATNAASELLIPKIDDFAKQSILRSCAIAAGKV